MKKIFLTSAVFIIVVLTMAVSTSPNKNTIDTTIKNAVDSGFVVMELFTSQGCSSCPKAEELLGSYVQKNDSRIISIAFHVDYWNALGWKDPFSAYQYSARQQKYNQDYLHTESVYTPQLIINGKKEFIGNNKEAIANAVSKALSDTALTTIQANAVIAKDKLNVRYAIDGDIANSTINFVLIKHKTITTIKAGENKGATLANYNVALHLLSTAAKDSGMCILQLPIGVEPKDLSLVLFTQYTKSGKITGAMQKELY